jgi:hypothetical protein
MERHLNNETRRRTSGRATQQAAVAMKKLDALIAGFADEVFRAIRGATLEELAELRGAPPPAVREPLATRAAVPMAPMLAPAASRKAAPWPSPLKPHVTRSARNAQNAHVVAEITDPESLLRLEAAPPPTHAEPAPETPPPISTEKPISSVAVHLRANEALVRASGAGVVIRRRKGA